MDGDTVSHVDVFRESLLYVIVGKRENTVLEILYIFFSEICSDVRERKEQNNSYVRLIERCHCLERLNHFL